MEYAFSELLTRDEILRILAQRKLSIPEMERLTPNELFRIYKTFVVPRAKRERRSRNSHPTDNSNHMNNNNNNSHINTDSNVCVDAAAAGPDLEMDAVLADSPPVAMELSQLAARADVPEVTPAAVTPARGSSCGNGEKRAFICDDPDPNTEDYLLATATKRIKINAKN